MNKHKKVWCTVVLVAVIVGIAITIGPKVYRNYQDGKIIKSNKEFCETKGKPYKTLYDKEYPNQFSCGEDIFAEPYPT